ncbi:roadblock/LC7 domain-containing protein [candidate division WOR-3 bacterium]|nr:roadblock/LC7 domain-containing protein [candidate division WOR-3 bacterium]
MNYLAECLERARICQFTGRLCINNHRSGQKAILHFARGEPQNNGGETDKKIIDAVTKWECKEVDCIWFNSNNQKETIMALTEEHLLPLSKIEGFRGAVIYSSKGELLVHHLKSDIAIPPEGMAAFGAELSKFSRKISTDMQIGAAEFCRIETPDAVLIHRCVEPGTVGMSVLADQSANVGMIVFTMNKIIEKVRSEGL